ECVTMKTEQNKVAEIILASSKVYTDPFNTVCVDAVVTGPDGITRCVPAFWAGGSTWKFRYASEKVGIHHYITQCSDTENEELHGTSGEIEVAPYEGTNPLYLHGAPVRKGDDLYLTHKDGTPFFWLGDTWWMGFTTRLSWPDGFSILTADRVEKGFSVIQIIAGLYPDMLPFDEHGANEGGFPWDKEYKAINPAYFDAADKKIEHLAENGLVPCVVGCWGFFMKFAGKETIKRQWKNIIARWGAYPVVWCLAGEANMTFYDDASVPHEEHLKNSRKDWNDIALFVHANDPFDRLVTIHPTSNGHEQIDDETLLGLDMLQTGHSAFSSLVPTIKQMTKAIERKKLPVINSEVCYEGICNSSYHDVQRYLFWSNVMLGACGHTYGANGIWQLNTVEKPYGVSPHGAHWGSTPWDVAYKLPGSFQVGIAKKFWTRFEWQNFEKHPEWINRHNDGESISGGFAVGIPGKVRIIFRPFLGGFFWNSDPVYQIEKDVTYRAVYFNPVTGDETDLGIISPDADGTWVSPRVNAFQDWILALIADCSVK
ncbi:MAG: DUF4038 domain-containing protein, partial [Eubacteriales bacterium]